MFCNKLSEKYQLQPVYKIENGLLIKIIYYNGEEVDPWEANFAKTEGYRLPTVFEWEWAARGGKIAQENGTFNYVYSGSNKFEEIGWKVEIKKINPITTMPNQYVETKPVGQKKPNQLGIYDMSGNVGEWCYDTIDEYFQTKESKKIMLKNIDYSYNGGVFRQIKGKSYDVLNDEGYKILDQSGDQYIARRLYVGFRICRTSL